MENALSMLDYLQMSDEPCGVSIVKSGSSVKLHSLSGCANFNGTFGRVLKQLPQDGRNDRWQVKHFDRTLAGASCRPDPP